MTTALLRKLQSALEKQDDELIGVVEEVCERENGFYVAIDAVASSPSDLGERTLAFVAASKSSHKDVSHLLGYLMWLPPRRDKSTVINLLTAIQRMPPGNKAFLAMCGSRLLTHLRAALAHPQEAVREAGLDVLDRLMKTQDLFTSLSPASAKALAAAISSDAWSDLYQEDAQRLSAVLAQPRRFRLKIPSLEPTARPAAGDDPWNLSVQRGSDLVWSALNQAGRIARLASYASAKGSVAQILRLSGGAVISGEAPLRILSDLFASWDRLLGGVTTKKIPSTGGFRVLRTVPGSFSVELAATESLAVVAHYALARVGELIASPGLESLISTIPSASTRSSLLDMAEQLVDGQTSLEIINIDPKGESPFLHQVFTYADALRVNEWALTAPMKVTTTHTETAVLEAANLRKGTFMIVVPGTPVPLSGRFPSSNRNLLKGKRIGATYVFSLRKTQWDDLRKGQQAEWDLESVSPVDVGAEQENVDDGVNASEPGKLPSDAIPQKEDFDRIIQAVITLVRGDQLLPEDFDYRVRRSIDYVTHAAKVLGLLTSRRTPTAAGEALANLPTDRRYEFLACQFETSAVGLAWRNWSGVNALSEVSPESSEAFLRECVAGLSPITLGRRARTLRLWWKRLIGTT